MEKNVLGPERKFNMNKNSINDRNDEEEKKIKKPTIENNM